MEVPHLLAPLEHRFTKHKPNPPAPFPIREGGAKFSCPRRGEVLPSTNSWLSTIFEHRRRLNKNLQASPSLKKYFLEAHD
ncbi:DUF29 family protein [Scytonema sp. PCC 10023]|uniref:DUF29 family protein n=1 Tax=Scytonema sp. PCC 10023 TaxID=1680591 RepID=UPI0039C5B053